MFGFGVAVTLHVSAQQGEGPGPGDRPLPRGEEGPGRMETITDAQKDQVKVILSKYDANALTADQAKAIHETFRQAGIRGGPAMGDAIKAAGFDPDKLRDLAPPPGRGSEANDRQQGQRGSESGADMSRGEPEAGQGQLSPGRGGEPRSGDERPAAPGQEARGQGKYTLSQAVSDRAQLSTIAFDGLAFVTGDFGASTFMPPGKVCDFFGFQYMRDIDAAGKGHNPMFLTRVAGNVLHILNDQQRQLFADLAEKQASQFEQLAIKRMPLILAFHRQKDGLIPQGSSGLNREAVARHTGDIFAFDAELSYRRAEVFGQVVASFSAEQKAAFAKMKFGDFNTWADLDERDALKRPNPGAFKFFTVAYMTYASEFFSWYAGSVEADVYFCPERHGTYFGGFYMKDMPAMGKRNYDISTAVTGDSGEAFLRLLSAEQRGSITSITDKQRKALAEVVEVRKAMSTELRKFLAGGKADKERVLALGRRYGELDGEMSWMYATAFASVSKTLTAAQRAACVKLRNLDGYKSAPAYLYSRPLQTLPALPDTDFLFAAPAAARTGSSAGTGLTVTAATSAARPAISTSARTGFVMKSTEVTDGGILPKDYTGDGSSATLPLEWSGAPAGTKSYALIMHHIDPEGKTKWYWVLYNIPSGTTSLPKNVKNIGTLGNNSVNGRVEYAPPHSKGPGAKTYVYTVYALSAPVKLDANPSDVNREVLLSAMKDNILAASELRVVYSRPAGITSL